MSQTNPNATREIDLRSDQSLGDLTLSSIETLTLAALGEIPEVGWLVSAMVSILWPTTDQSVWDQIREQVEEVVNEKIEDSVYSQVDLNLAGLRNVLADYAVAIGHDVVDGPVVSQKWNAAHALFLQALPSFQNHRYAFHLLPLFAQFANLWLLLLQDGARHGGEWDWMDTTVGDCHKELIDKAKEFYDYTWQVYRFDQATSPVRYGDKDEKASNVSIFKGVNSRVRIYHLFVRDYAVMWKRLDTQQPNKADETYNDREIFSDPAGRWSVSGPIPLDLIMLQDNMPHGQPTHPPSEIIAWGGDLLDAMQVTYPAGGGPKGITTTGRMGGPGGTRDYPLGGTVEVEPDHPIVTAWGHSGDCVDGVGFILQGNTDHNMPANVPTLIGEFGRGRGRGGGEFWWAFPGHRLSSIRISGTSPGYRTADNVVFGFQYIKDRPLSDKTHRALYVGAPTQSLADGMDGRLGKRSDGGAFRSDLPSERTTWRATLAPRSKPSHQPWDEISQFEKGDTDD